MNSYANALRRGMTATTCDVSVSIRPRLQDEKPKEVSNAGAQDKKSFLDLPRELRDQIYECCSHTMPEPEIKRGFTWAHSSFTRELPVFGLMLCCKQVAIEYAEELARHPLDTTLVIEIGGPLRHPGWRDRSHNSRWWRSRKYRGFEGRLAKASALELVYHATNDPYPWQAFERIHQSLNAKINLDDRKKTRFIYSLDMSALQHHLQQHGSILPAAKMRNAFYTVTDPGLPRLTDWANAGIGGPLEWCLDMMEEGMRLQRGQYVNETVTLVHDKLFCARNRRNKGSVLERHPKNRITYEGTLAMPERRRVLSAEEGYVVGINNVVPQNIDAVEFEVVPQLTGSFEEAENGLVKG